MTKAQLEQGNTLSKHLEEYTKSMRALSEQIMFLNEKPAHNWNFIYNTWENDEIKQLYEEMFLNFTIQLKNMLARRIADLEKAFREI